VPIGIIRNDWNVAGDVMRESKRDKRQNTGLGANEKTPDGKAWDELWYTAREKIGDVPTIWDAPWNAMIEVTQDRAGDAMRESMDDDSMTMPWNVERDAAGNAAWTIVEDEMSEWGYTKGNPFSPLISIYELGYLPIGLAINGKGLKEFNIFIPPIKKAAINMHN
jgi:hypothetical protein